MTRAGRDEAEAAYFTLLRAREELSAIGRYAEYLDAEAARIARFAEDGSQLAAGVAPALRRPVAHTDDPLAELLRSRLTVVDEERTKLGDRMAAAQAFVDECEAELSRLRAARPA